MNFLVLFLTRPKYIRSPHLRAKFGELLFSVFLPNENQSKNPLSKPSVQCGLLLSSHHLACTFSIFSLSLSLHTILANTIQTPTGKHLASGLMRLYGDVEHTGFYEKMNNRFKIALALKHVWPLESHRPAVLTLAQEAMRRVSRSLRTVWWSHERSRNDCTEQTIPDITYVVSLKYHCITHDLENTSITSSKSYEYYSLISSIMTKT